MTKTGAGLEPRLPLINREAFFILLGSVTGALEEVSQLGAFGPIRSDGFGLTLHASASERVSLRRDQQAVGVRE